MLIAQVRAATAGRLLLSYLFVRQATSALGLTSLGGHPQMVRPLVAPMAEGAAEVQAGGDLPDKVRFRIRGMSAATDNIGLFFGEDIFIAIGSIVLMVGFLEQAGIIVEPLQLSVWAIPTAIAAFAVHGARLLLFDREIRRDLAARNGGGPMITLEHAYILVGLMFLAFAVLTLRDPEHPTRIRSAIFWG